MSSNSPSLLAVPEAYIDPNYKFAPLITATVALVKDRYKLIHYFGYSGYDSEYELYDLQNDPEEVENLYASSKPLAAELGDELQEKLLEVNRPFMTEPLVAVPCFS